MACKITGGRPTTTRKSSFEAMCRAHQAAINKNFAGPQRANPECVECGGKHIPPEVNFNEDIMSSNREKQICENCGQEKQLQLNNSKLVCPTCVVIRGAAKLRPASVIGALREFHGSLMQWLNEAEVKEVGAAYGVSAEVAEEVVGGVRDIISENEQLKAQVKDLNGKNDRLMLANEKLRGGGIDQDQAVDNLQKALTAMTAKFERSQVEITNLNAKLQHGNGVDRSKLLSLALDIAQCHFDGNINVNPDNFRELRKVAVGA